MRNYGETLKEHRLARLKKMSNYGEELKYQREKRNKTLKQIEQDTEISTANLSRWENGKVLPNIDFCVILADYYGISLDELIGRDTNDK